MATRSTWAAAALAAVSGGGLACFVDVPLDPAATASSSSTTDTCPQGQQGCPCLPGGACAADLFCEAQRCVAPAVCGDGLVTGEEECDDGDADDADECTNACRFPVCGDGIIWVGVEVCDDGGPVQGDGCNTDCMPSGALRWQQTASGPGAADDTGFAVAVGLSGEIYVVGGLRPAPDRGRDVWFARYSPDGALEWEKSVAGVADLDDFGRAVAVAPNGDIIVGAVTRLLADDDTPDDEVTLGRFAGADGRELWTTTITGPLVGGSDSVRAILIEADQTIVVAGQQQSGPSGQDFWLARLDATGALLWSRAHDGGGGADTQTDRAFGLTRGAGGALVLCGQRDGPLGPDAWILVTDGDGQRLWDRAFDGGAKNPENAASCAADAAGTIYVVVNEATAGDFWLLSYSAAGQLGWQLRVGEPDGAETAHHLVLSDTGEVIVVGSEPGGAGGRDLSVRKYDPAAQLRWRRSLGGPADDIAYGAAIAPGGAIVVTGERSSERSGFDLWLGKFSP
jgi:cysteine-rich repeat protein